MFSVPQFKNIGAWLESNLGLAPVTITAGGAGDGTAQAGPAINRVDAKSCVVAVPHASTLATGETVDYDVRLEDSADGSTGWADYAQPTYSGAAYKAYQQAYLAGGESGIIEFDVNLEGAKAYVRAQVTATLSAGSTDTSTFAAVVTLAGFDADSHLPK
jgi:hypothetical protein